MERDLQNRAELTARLTQINSWLTEQNLWIDSAQTPSSRTELQRSIGTCQVRGHSQSSYVVVSLQEYQSELVSIAQDLKEKIREKSAALQRLRDKHTENGSASVSQVDESVQSCAALTQQVCDAGRVLWR